MANARGILVLGASLLLGGVAAKGASVYMKNRVAAEVQSRAGDTRPQKEMLVATRDLALSARISTEDLELVRVPANTVPPTALSDAELVIGRITRAKIYQGEPVLEPKLAPKGARGGLQAVIPDGFRAMTVKVNEVIGVAGFVLPGSRVDVVAVIKRPRGDAAVSKVVLQNIEVLAVDQVVETVDNKPKPSSAVTLLVVPQDAEKLALAVNQGDIQLIMRAYADETLVATPGTDAFQIVYRPSGAVAAPASTNTNVEVIERTRRSKTSVSGSGPVSLETINPDVKVR